MPSSVQTPGTSAFLTPLAPLTSVTSPAWNLGPPAPLTPLTSTTSLAWNPGSTAPQTPLTPLISPPEISSRIPLSAPKVSLVNTDIFV